MKRTFGHLLLLLGVFLIVLGPLVKWVVAPRVIKAPLEIPQKYIHIIAHGDKFKYLDAKAGGVVPISVNVTRTIIGDVGKNSGGDSDVAVYDESLCLTRDDGSHPGCVSKLDSRLVANSTDRIAFDRKSGMAVNKPKYRENVDGDPTVRHEGLGYKFPIDTTKTKAYLFFDTVVGKAFPMVYSGTEKMQGLKVYRFVQKIVSQPVYTNHALPSTYTNTRTVWIEPTTGAIIDGQEELTQTLTGRANLDPKSDLRDPALAGLVALQGTLRFTSDTVKLQAQLAKDNLPKIHLVRLWVPLISLIVGALALVGAVLLLGRRDREPPDEGDTSQSQPATEQGPPGFAPPPQEPANVASPGGSPDDTRPLPP